MRLFDIPIELFRFFDTKTWTSLPMPMERLSSWKSNEEIINESGNEENALWFDFQCFIEIFHIAAVSLS